MGYVVKPADPDRLVPAIEAAHARAGDARKLRDTGRQLQTALDADQMLTAEAAETDMDWDVWSPWKWD